MQLRGWMEKNDIPRQEVADFLGITRGHLSTLINANRHCTTDQVAKALELMACYNLANEWSSAPSPPKPKPAKPQPQKRVKKAPKRKELTDNNLRPLTKVETSFVKDVAQAWLDANQNSSHGEFTEIVRALSIGIRS